MKQLLRNKYLNHRNSRRKVEREEIESGVELQSRESEEEDSGLLNYKTNIKFVYVFWTLNSFFFERLYSLSYIIIIFISFRYLILGIEGGPFFMVHGGECARWRKSLGAR